MEKRRRSDHGSEQFRFLGGAMLICSGIERPFSPLSSGIEKPSSPHQSSPTGTCCLSVLVYNIIICLCVYSSTLFYHFFNL